MASLSWKGVLDGEREKPYFQQLLSFIEEERRSGKIVYPPNQEIFNALALTEFYATRVVIVGQDPYHGPEQAHGLAFSVRKGTTLPPSLRNIFKEIVQEFAVPLPGHGCLEKWAHQGVLLLNAVLSVEKGLPGSHANKGWERFTDRVVSELNDRKNGVVFLLWGQYAQKKGTLIDTTRHHVLKAAHPSPLSVHNGFFGCGHFRAVNEILSKRGESVIDWT